MIRQAKEDQTRKMAQLAAQYEKSISDMLEQQTVEMDVHHFDKYLFSDGCL